MKKVLYTVAIVAALGLASCGGKKAAEEVAPAAAPETENVENGTCNQEGCCNEEGCDKECTKEACCNNGEKCEACTNEECTKDGNCTEECCKAAAENTENTDNTEA